MKRRNRKSRQRFGAVRQPLGLFGIGNQRKRKGFTFERLEERMVFSAQTLPLLAPLSYQTSSYSNDTYEGAVQTYLRELEWANYQAYKDSLTGISTTTPVDGSITSGGPNDASKYALAALPNDPLFAYQWHLLNTGQEVGNPNFPPLYGAAGEDINVVPVWNMGYTGEGISVAILDSGVQITHPDLVANIDPTRRYNAVTQTNNVSPALFDGSSFHGTAVAGITGSTWNNLGGPVLDEDDNPVLDVNGNPVYQGGGSGVAPNVTLVPIQLLTGLQNVTDDPAIMRAFQYSLQNDVDITNNSWGSNVPRLTLTLSPEILQLLRESVLFGRDGLGMINVFASGNSGGPAFSPGFQSFGGYDSANYDAYRNSRYTIAVTGVDHDGEYRNADGTFTSYPEGGSSVLVAAPTGSNVAQNVADDIGQGSGIWTADLIGDFGANAAPMNGFDDADLLADPDYTSRMNGTSASAPVVSGVIALMLEANPNLTFRDVQEILVRSSRQNAPLEIPTSGGLVGVQSTWQTNQQGSFQNPDPYTPFVAPDILQQFPVADPNAGGIPISTVSTDFDLARSIASRYEPQPQLFTNGAGYTVSQGYGVYSEQFGYAHGVVDAELAVQMALQWHTLGQNLDPFTEKTFTTFVLQGLGNIPAAERLPLNRSGLLIPGGLGGQGGFSAYWSEYFATNPFQNYTGPGPTSRGSSYVDFIVPADQAMNIEWVEVRLDISGNAAGLDFLRIMLTSPDGTQSELNHHYADPSFLPFASQPLNSPIDAIDPAGDLDGDGGNFTWTFSTNRSFGESTNTQVIINAVTGEPLFTVDPFTGLPADPIFRDWELHIENWGNEDFNLAGLEIVWHGKDTSLSSQLTLPNGALYGNLDPNWGVSRASRIQGIVGVDANSDDSFNYQRSVQTVGDFDGDPTTTHLTDVQRRLDFNDINDNGIYEPELGDTSNLEPFAENVVVQLFRVDPLTDLPEATPTQQFLTGADGNYYFDVDPTQTYEIRVLDPQNRPFLEDLGTNALYQQHYKQVWRITPDWYFAPDRDNPLGIADNPGEIFFGMSDANGDGIMTASPIPFTELRGDPVPMPVKNINFLIKQDAVPQQFDVTGTVYADLNANGIFDGNDALASNVFVYWDANRNKVADAGEMRVLTDAAGAYTLTIPASSVGTFSIGVIPPTNLWLPTDPGQDGVENVFAGPGYPTQHVDFFLDPPPGAFPEGGQGLGTIQGVVYNDLDGNGIQNPGENGVPNFRVFIDSNSNGIWDSATEESVITASNGSYYFSNVTPASVIRVDIVIPDEGTANSAWNITKPVLGYREFGLGPGGAVTMQDFGLDNLADFDFGDLPDSYQTSLASNGPRHLVTPGFQLGSSVDGEVNGSAGGEGLVGDNDDGVVIVSNGGVLQTGVNTLRVTVAGVGGLLTGWMDFNANGQFDANERLEWSLNGSNLGGEADINPGTWDLQITIPAGAVEGALATRFRWGEEGLSFFGPAAIGEVEDYYFGLNFLFGDYNRNGTVDAADYTLWRRMVSQSVTPYSGADGNGDGIVNQGDYDVWRAAFGQTIPAPGSGSSLGAGAGALTSSEGGSSGRTFGSAAAAAAAGAGFFGNWAGSQGSGSSGVSTDSVGGSSGGGSNAGVTSFVFAPSAGGTTYTASAASAKSASADSDAASGSNLLLVDLAIAGTGHASYGDVDGSLFDFEEQEDTSVTDLALAAVLGEGANWWKAI